MPTENSPPVSPVNPHRRNKMLRALSDEQIHLARILYHRDHRPIKTIARRFGVSSYTIWRWCVNVSEAEVAKIKATTEQEQEQEQEPEPEQVAV